jgi:RNA ligase
MQYEFPKDLTLDMVRNSIADSPEFVEHNRGTFIVFNYHISTPTSFDCYVRRECRGLIFSPEGQVLSRRFHKFFNMGEREETNSASIYSAMNNDHVILNKLDGSMITPIIIDDKFIRWGTKMGYGTDVAMAAESFVSNKTNYHSLAIECHEQQLTPIFEFISPSNRIVLQYPDTQLVLLALRENITGNYYDYNSMRLVAKLYDVPVVRRYDKPISKLKDETDIEGAVIAFDNGHRVKLKCDWYVAIHKTKDDILHEKNLLKIILENKVDDILPHLPAIDQKEILDYNVGVANAILSTVNNVHNNLVKYHQDGLTRKDFAISYSKEFNSIERTAFFKNWDSGHKQKNGIQESVIASMMNYCGSKTEINRLHKMIKFPKWR